MAAEKVAIREQFLALLKPPTWEPNSTPSGIWSQSSAHSLCPRPEKGEDGGCTELGHRQNGPQMDALRLSWVVRSPHSLQFLPSPPTLISPTQAWEAKVDVIWDNKIRKAEEEKMELRFLKNVLVLCELHHNVWSVLNSKGWKKQIKQILERLKEYNRDGYESHWTRYTFFSIMGSFIQPNSVSAYYVPWHRWKHWRYSS